MSMPKLSSLFNGSHKRPRSDEGSDSLAGGSGVSQDVDSSTTGDKSMQDLTLERPHKIRLEHRIVNEIPQEHKSKIDSLLAAVSQKEHLINEQTNEMEALKEKLSNLDTLLGGAQEATLHLESQNTRLMKEVKDLNVIKDDLDITKKNLTSKLADLNEALVNDANLKECLALQKENKSVLSSNKSLADAKGQLDAKVTSLETLTNKLKSEILDLQILTAQFPRRLDREKELKELEEDARNVAQTQLETSEQIESHESKVQELQLKLRDNAAEAEQIKNTKLQTLRDKIEGLNTKLVEKDSLINGIKGEKQFILAAIQELPTEVPVDLLSDPNSLEVLVESNKTLLNTKDTQISQRQSLHEEEVQKRINLESTIEEADALKATLKGKIQTLENDLGCRNEEITTLKSENQRQLVAWQTKETSWNQRLQDCVAKERYDALDQRHNNLQTILEQTKEQYNLATQEAKTNSENHRDLENKYNETVEQMKLLQNSCADARCELSCLKDNPSAIKTLQDESARKQMENDKLLKELAALRVCFHLLVD
ncbi:hypothetical protein BT96DRAFT_1005532 [Gymnopus androsaceus JB14]|uniref:Uncharacterized protein n=1 Tax=Gymnopus androsaceus JB14 TaxID=1447944 RepID=A0A6A4GN78_9AGAR|nr:hypothetical protein BT96DRAFT_1005532 [Gymnopus androsaceus JB14]